jgi:hypothetical protein
MTTSGKGNVKRAKMPGRPNPFKIAKTMTPILRAINAQGAQATGQRSALRSDL